MIFRFGFWIGILLLAALAGGCKRNKAVVNTGGIQNQTVQKPQIPPTLSEILDKKNTETKSPVGKVDFLNMTYPLPRGWQDSDSKEITLDNGRRPLTEDKIGMAYQAVKYGDATGDGVDEAFVILRIETGGSAIPQVVYIVEWKDGKQEIIWYFRTGDRADGGLKRVYADAGELVVELFGDDRYIFNQMETLKIVGDETQICCPSSFTRNRYKRVSNGFNFDGKRLTYSLTDPSRAPQENLGDQKLEESRGKNK